MDAELGSTGRGVCACSSSFRPPCIIPFVALPPLSHFPATGQVRLDNATAFSASGGSFCWGTTGGSRKDVVRPAITKTLGTADRDDGRDANCGAADRFTPDPHFFSVSAAPEAGFVTTHPGSPQLIARLHRATSSESLDPGSHPCRTKVSFRPIDARCWSSCPIKILIRPSGAR